MITHRSFAVNTLNWKELSDELGKDGWRPVSIYRLEDGQFHLVFAKRRTDRPVKYSFFEVAGPDVPKTAWLDNAYWDLSGFFWGLYQTQNGEYRYLFYREEDHIV